MVLDNVFEQCHDIILNAWFEILKISNYGSNNVITKVWRNSEKELDWPADPSLATTTVISYIIMSKHTFSSNMYL